MNTMKKQNNKGFSMIELLISIGIMSVVLATVAVLMSTSSETYNRVSTDSQLQSEAQLVANSIMNIAVDSINASCDATIAAPGSAAGDFDKSDKKILILTNDVDNKRYVIARDKTENKLYYFEQTKTGDTYGALSDKALLGDYITDFDVNVDRVASKNLITFTLTYLKNGKTYKGDYQVFMRNRKYESKTVSMNEPPFKIKDIVLKPTEVIVEVRQGKLSNVGKKEATGYFWSGTNGTYDLNFDTTVFYDGRPPEGYDIESCNWNMIGADQNFFNLTKKKGKDSTVRIEKVGGDSFNDLTKFNFNVTAAKENITKRATIIIKIVKKLKLSITSGNTPWKDTYLSDPYNGKKAVNVPNSNYGQQGSKMTVSAALEKYNVDEGVKWTLEWAPYDSGATAEAGIWNPCDSSIGVSILNTTSTINTVTIANDSDLCMKKFRITATSIFDQSVHDSILFGIVPKSSVGSSDGFYSRGYYVDMSEYFSKNPPQSDVEIVKLLKIESGTGDNFDKQGGVKVAQGDDGRWYFFVDYDTFQYDYGQEEQFYMDRSLQMKITYTKYFEEAGVKKEVQESKTVHYPLKAIEVTPAGPSAICVKKGSYAELFGKIAYANLTNKDLISIYTKQSGASASFSSNINVSGLEASDKYLQIALDENALGTTKRFVDTAKLDIFAKTNLKTYPIDAVTVRMALKNFYNINKNTKSYYDFKVYIANVDETDVYIPGPNATKVDDSTTKIGWPNSFSSSKTSTVRGISSTTSDEISAQVYQSGNNYYCTYKGNTYKYNKTYEYWQK